MHQFNYSEMNPPAQYLPSLKERKINDNKVTVYPIDNTIAVKIQPQRPMHSTWVLTASHFPSLKRFFGLSSRIARDI